MTEVSAPRAIPNVPKDAAAVILLRPNSDPKNPEVFWVKRSAGLAFLGGFHAFPGGQIDSTDSGDSVRNDPNAATCSMSSGGARERFEVFGGLGGRGGETVTRGQRES